MAVVFDRSADVIDSHGKADVTALPPKLAAASATSRSEVFDHRLGARFGRAGASRNLVQAAAQADRESLAAAIAVTVGPVPPRLRTAD
jgi:hypothetical protein